MACLILTMHGFVMQKNKKLHQQLKEAESHMRQDVQGMQAHLQRSNQSLDTAPDYLFQGTPPAPQISPASPPKPDTES